jgi:hypothetical protein
MLKTYLKVAPPGTLKKIGSIILEILKKDLSGAKSLGGAIAQNVWKNSAQLAAVRGTEMTIK